MKTSSLVAASLTLTAVVAFAAAPPLPSTAYTRGLLRARNVGEAQAVLNISAPNTNRVAHFTVDGPSTNKGTIYLEGTAGVSGASTVGSTVSHIYTNSWAGPSAAMDLSKGSVDYLTYVPVTVTGFSGFQSASANPSTLAVYNGAATNVTLTIPDTVRTLDGLRVYTITNGTLGMLTVEWKKHWTNATFAIFR